MRLRLRIERNGLPPTQALWPVKDGKSTIAQLLQHINDIFPLEAETWGLEDYAVTVSGYECLHWHEIKAVCKDEDEVVVRALQLVDLRSRTMTGRDQITADGRHLLDGVPFGRPCLKEPVRPDIRIPPRKRRKLIHDQEEDGVGGGADQLKLTEKGEELDEEDEDEDEHLESNASVSSDASGDESETSDSISEEDSTGTSSSESSEDDSEDISDEESEDMESWSGLPRSETTTPSRKAASSQLANSVAESPTSSKRKRPSNEAEDHSVAPGHEIKALKIAGLPFEGTPVTKARNARRRDTRKLKLFKQIGVLPNSASLSALHQWELNNPNTKVSTTPTTAVVVDFQTMEPVVPSDAPGDDGDSKHTTTGAVVDEPDVDVDIESLAKRKKKSKKAAEVDTDPNVDFEKRRRTLISKITSGGIDVTQDLADDDEPPLELSSKRPVPFTNDSPAEVSENDAATKIEDTTKLTQTTPRSRLDTAGTQRLIFGSLGMRPPKTQEEREKARKKLAERPNKNITIHQEAPQANGVSQEESQFHEEEDAESWRGKINLTAVECCDEGVKLSAPPFPFVQRWDAKYRKEKSTKRKGGLYMDVAGKKRRRAKLNGEHVETYDKYNADGYGDALNYDDDAGEEGDEYWEDGALLDGQYEDGDEKQQSDPMNDGFPDHPTDIDSLPVVGEDGAKQGDFITFAELACDESTEWQPKMVTRLAKLRERFPDGQLWTLQLSARDLPPKIFDAEGNRVYSKFEMPDDDDDEDDEGMKVVDWRDLGIVRLVSRPIDGAADT